MLFRSGLFTNGSTVPATLAAPTEDWTGPVMEDYTGKTLDDVKASFQGTIKVDADGAYSDHIEKGKIISQEPAAGSPVYSAGSDAVIYMLINLLVDISYNYVDPRMRLRR